MVASQPAGEETSGRQAQPTSCPVWLHPQDPPPKQVRSEDRDEPGTRSRDLLQALPLWDLK